MATTNDKLEQQKAQTQELADDELDQATGGGSTVGPDNKRRKLEEGK